MKQGLFVTFEGGEGAGKTTLIDTIAAQLKTTGRIILKTREPGGTQLGEEIREILLKHRKEPLSPYSELSLFLASRSQHIREVIRPALDQGMVVLCDRFNDSTIAYQGAARGLGTEKVAAFCDFISEGLVPNLTLYLDIDPESGLKRAKNARAQDRIELENLEFHRKIRDAYLHLAKAHPKRFYRLDASQPPAIVFDEAMQRIRKHV